MMVINILLLQRLLQADFNKDHTLTNNSKVESVKTNETSHESSKIHANWSIYIQIDRKILNQLKNDVYHTEFKLNSYSLFCAS